MPTISEIGGERTILLSEKEAAELLGVSDRTIRNYLTKGFIPSVTINRRTYIWDQNLLAFIRGAKTTRRRKGVNPPEYASFPPDPWESP